MSARRRKLRSARKPRTIPAPAPLFAPAIARLGQVADSVLAKQLGVSTYRIKQERQARGIGPFVARLEPGLVKDVVKTIRLTPAEEAAQLAAAARAGVEWGAWIRGLGNSEAQLSARRVEAQIHAERARQTIREATERVNAAPHVYDPATSGGIGQCRVCGSDDENDGSHQVDPQERDA